MPKAKQTDKVPANKQKGKKRCTCCHEEKKLTDFYLSYSPLYSLDRRVPICKECCKKSILNDDGSINDKKFKDLLRNIDKPLYYDSIESAMKSVKKENSYVSEEEIKLHGYEILSKYFTLMATRQDRAKSYSDSEKDGFMHQNNNRNTAEKAAIKNKFISPISSDVCLEEKNKSVRLSKKDKQNMNYSISIVGYDPFEDLNMTDIDRKYCFNILAGYCDTDGVKEDGHKLQCVIQLATLYLQCKKVDEGINQELLKNNPNEQKIKTLVSTKKLLQDSIATIAKDNAISASYNKNSKQGQNSLTSLMKEMEEHDFEEIKVNLFDIKTSEAFEQIADLSNKNLMSQLTLDNNDYTEIVKEQNELIQKYEKDIGSLQEENRKLKNQIITLEGVR